MNPGLPEFAPGDNPRLRPGPGGAALLLRCLLVLSVWPAWARGAEVELTRLAEGVFADLVDPDSAAVANSGIVVLDRGVLVFDTHFTPEAAQALRRRIAAVTSKSILFVVNSHFHADHTHGNQAFREAPYLISSADARRDIVQRDIPALNRTMAVARSQLEQLQKELAQPKEGAPVEALRAQVAARQQLLSRMSSLTIVAPQIAFEGPIRIVDGVREISLRTLGPAHTDGDALLILPGERIAFVGDLFCHRGLPNSQDASLLAWTKALKELLTLDVERFVPGHGAIGTKADVEEFLGYFTQLREAVEPAVIRGEPLEQVISEVRIPPRYAGYRFQNFFAANVQKMYTELKAARLEADPRPGGERRPAEPGLKTP